MSLEFVKRITSKGIKTGMTLHEEKGIIIANYILLLAAVVSFGRIFLFYLYEDTLFSIISVFACFFFSFAYFMNTRQYYDFAKFTTVLAGNGAILIKELVSGGTSNQLYLMIASYGIVLMLFSIKDKTKIIFAFMIPTISISLSIFFPNIVSEPIILNPNVAKMEKLIGVASAVIIIILVIRYFVKQSTENELKLIHSNELLRNYNDEISEQKELIEEQYIELEQINDDLMTQKGIIEQQHRELTDSITYASTIQHAILPWKSTLKKAFGDILIFYKPKDIVSGDSYWFQEVDGIKFLAVIDCTGHGIPGAMLTVIAATALDDAVLGKRLSDTGQILTYMNDKVTEVLNQKLEENKIRDGMEVCMLAIHQNKIQFSGAGRPLYLKNGTLEIIKTDKRGIAGQTENDEYTFSSLEIERTENMMLYLTSDGYSDQMDEKSKKFSTKRLVALLDTISEKPISEQHEILENEFNNHRGDREQIDDVTILGVKI
ncbi:MAG: SpoIIE family protein phosphatase [Candidatus Kapabacteria bacterium]|nr:SpoIIE family protein phosphatase [Ignavibacteriota bacterium]MCW5886450.1 SpoIIE family protein phosphatase [Candidatus Kapabacteria bacterium]